MRQIILDTETTGLEPAQGHRIIEIGCVEMVNRRLTGNHFHFYINPEREIDAGALAVHGITNEFLADKPIFHTIAEQLFAYIRGAQLIIHNAPFDIGFLNHEFNLLGSHFGKIEEHCSVLDTLVMARQMHPGQKNSLDALCKRYKVDNSQRELHGALLDANILALVYLAMTSGQSSLFGIDETESTNLVPVMTTVNETEKVLDKNRTPLSIIRADEEELAAHQAYLELIKKHSETGCLWEKIDSK